jgi:hypothetical protein
MYGIFSAYDDKRISLREIQPGNSMEVKTIVLELIEALSIIRDEGLGCEEP